MRRKIGFFMICLLAVTLLGLGFQSAYLSPVNDDNTTVDRLENGIIKLGFVRELETHAQIRTNVFYRYRYWMIGIGVVLIFGTLWIAALNFLVQTRTKALFESNEQLTHTQNQNIAIINAIPDAIFVLDNDTHVLECKIEASAIPFPSRTDMLMRKLSDIIPKPYGEKLIEAIGKVSNVNELHHMDLEMKIESSMKYYEIRIIRSGKNEVIALIRDMTTHYENLENIKYLSYHDQLTGLYNRYMFEEELERLDVIRNFPLSIVMADVNGLKLVNDCFGHPVGDELLIKFSEMLKRVFRADDIICRMGGDEFVIILPQTTYDVASHLIERLSKACDEIKFYNLNLSVAFGCATKINAGDSIKEVMKYAEDQMYKRKLFESPKIKELMIEKLLDSLFEAIDTEKLHSESVEALCASLGNAIGLNTSDLETLKIAAKHHDIGKIAIDHKVLFKKDPLTDEELESIRSHCDIGYRILSVVNNMSDCAEVILAHHERWDGTGYPKGLIGDDIPMMSRIITIADAYCAMTTVSHYKALVPPEVALEEIEKHLGTQFDPILGRKFVMLMKHD